MGALLTALQNKSCLSTERYLGFVVFVVGSGLFRMNEENELALLLFNFCFARTSTALNKGTKKRGIVHVTLVGTPTVVVHPVAVNVASLVIAVTL